MSMNTNAQDFDNTVLSTTDELYDERDRILLVEYDVPDTTISQNLKRR